MAEVCEETNHMISYNILSYEFIQDMIGFSHYPWRVLLLELQFSDVFGKK